MLTSLFRFNVRVGFHGADLSKPKEIESLVKYAKDTHGGIDVLVNNAGIQHVSPIGEKERRMTPHSINLTDPFF